VVLNLTAGHFLEKPRGTPPRVYPLRWKEFVMTTVHIELPDEQAAALTAKATAQGLTLEGWFQKIASQEAPAQGKLSPKKSAYGLLAKYGPGPSEEEIDDNRRDMFRGFAEDAP
jgi:hypothetical protein